VRALLGLGWDGLAGKKAVLAGTGCLKTVFCTTHVVLSKHALLACSEPILALLMLLL